MPYQLVFTDDYTRRALRFLRRHPDLATQYTKILALLKANPHHPGLPQLRISHFRLLRRRVH